MYGVVSSGPEVCVGVECCGIYRGGGDGGGESVLRGEGGVDITSGDSAGVPMVDMGDVGAVGGKGVFGLLSV